MEAINENYEDNAPYLKDWSDEDRIGFIRKVYGILSLQLTFTAFMSLIVLLSSSFRLYLITHPGIALTLAIIGLGISCALFCIKDLARKVPTNYYLMFAFTFCEAYMVAYVCAFVKDPRIVLTAAFMTAGMVVGLTIYARTTKKDFTFFGGFLFVALFAFMIFGLFSFMFGPTMRFVYCLIGVIIFGVYLIADTQLIIGGRTHELDKDDYIFGAIILYLDIINIFLYLL